MSLPNIEMLQSNLIAAFVLIFTSIIGIVLIKLLLHQFAEDKPQHSSQRDHNRQQLRRNVRKKRYDGVYYLPCLNKQYGRFCISSERRNILNTKCLICGKNDMDMNNNSYGYECDVLDGCWCCSVYCYNKHLLAQTLHLTPLDQKCYPLYFGYVRDRINGHNKCKLNVYQSDYELKLQFLLIGFVSQYFDRNTVTEKFINAIFMYYNTKIMSFDQSVYRNEYINFDQSTNKVLQIKQHRNKNCLYFIPTYSRIILTCNNIYYAIIKCVDVELNGFYMGIIPVTYGITNYLIKPVTNIGNCYVYGSNGKFCYNSHSKYAGWYQAGDTIKCIIDMKFGVISFRNSNRPDHVPVAFKINKYIEYRFIVATLHNGDQYQLL
eukprot:397686_1